MGTWGPGNFDSDQARDYVGNLAQGLERYIQGILDHQPQGTGDYCQASLDELGESRLMPSVAILIALHETFRAGVPRPETVADWRDRYLRVYDDEIDKLAPRPGFKEQRRQVIADTFGRLYELSSTFWKEMPGPG
jgi:hypothetical protein